MDFTTALSKIKALDADDSAELVSAIEGKVSELEQKVYTVIGEKRGTSQKSQALQSALEAIAQSLSLDGELDDILDKAQPKIKALAAEAQQLRQDKETLESRASDAESKLTGYERKDKFQKAAALIDANPAVLEQLLKDRASDLAIADGTAKLGEAELKAAIEADETLKPFLPALFPANGKPARSRLPDTPPGSETAKPQNPAKRAISDLKFAVPGG